MSRLFTPITIRELTIPNRVFVSPMCQYSCRDGIPSDWHLVHLGSRAVGGAGLVMAEATSVSPAGRISPADCGIWNVEQVEAFRRITAFIKGQGSVAGIQLGHAGRKASTRPPWQGGGPLNPEEKPWPTLAPSSIPFAPDYPVPGELSSEELTDIVNQFSQAVQHSIQAGFQVIEIHMAHGYLLHEFLSPLTNKRTDQYGGDFENRVRFPLEVAKVVRDSWPGEWPVFVRISCTDWVEGGWNLPQTVEFSKLLKEEGIDLIDCSSGGIAPGIKIPAAPGYQTVFSQQVRREVQILSAAVGLITEPFQAEHILTTGQADAVLLGREFLRHPYWPRDAAKKLGDTIPWPSQYERAR